MQRFPPVGVLFEVRDYDGNIVSLDEERFLKHICKHPEMKGAEDAIRKTIENPGYVLSAPNQKPTHSEGERRVLIRLGAHPRYSSLNVIVPIEYSPAGNWVVTAYVSFSPPAQGEVLYVRYH